MTAQDDERPGNAVHARQYDEVVNPRHRRLVIPVALGALILIVIVAALF